jgi:hypothetical protein
VAALALAATADAIRHQARAPSVPFHVAVRAPQADVSVRGRSGQVATGSFCPGNRIRLRYPDGREIYALRGCAPAWKPPPDSDLTFVRDGTVVELEEPCRWERADCLRVVLSQRSLDTQMHGAWRLQRTTFEVRRMHWVTRDRLVAVVRRRARSGADFVAVFANGRLVRAPGVR